MKVKALPPAEYLRECFLYDPQSGDLFWKKRPKEHFSNEGEWKRWNGRYAGTKALNSLSDRVNGYKKGNIDGVRYKAHRVIWKLVTGNEPPLELDHEDRDEANNRWRNLRIATRSLNCWNRTMLPPRSGVRGVHARGRLWHFRITKDGQHYWRGGFASQADAHEAYREKSIELFGGCA